MAVMGRVIGPYGVSGWIKVFPYTEYIDGLLDYPTWWLGRGDGEWRKFKVNAGEVHGNILTALLEQYSDRTAAMRLKGLQVAIPRTQLPVLPKSGKDGYYWSDLIDLEVVNLQGEELGKVAGLLETGANDVLQVKSMNEDETERLIPFISQVIAKVDLKARRITVDWGVDY
ncbi:ribosome maturation factor RimM [Nitrosovibrio sp. Nv6]|uniref:ribosome maturation factor RimM n=1 Tax=Nitrosovibrio sp. Nv6 TaxID=1855340 RepID=UPI000B89C295|nr:ribosome maturation factor RimM [Nitrosovibrio sp. Nv6]